LTTRSHAQGTSPEEAPEGVRLRSRMIQGWLRKHFLGEKCGWWWSTAESAARIHDSPRTHPRRERFATADLGLSTDKTESRNHFRDPHQEDGFGLADLEVDQTALLWMAIRVGTLYFETRHPRMFHVGGTAIRFQPLAERVENCAGQGNLFRTSVGSVRQRCANLVRAPGKRLLPRTLTVLIGRRNGNRQRHRRPQHPRSQPAQGKPFIVVGLRRHSRATSSRASSSGTKRVLFTDAVEMRRGCFRMANEGTVFLDEIGELPLDLQPKLLRTSKSRGPAHRQRPSPPAHVRILAATNRNLMEWWRKTAFREDLYFRIAVARLLVPALAKRKDDVPILVEHFLTRLRQERLPVKTRTSLRGRRPRSAKPPWISHDASLAGQRARTPQRGGTRRVHVPDRRNRRRRHHARSARRSGGRRPRAFRAGLPFKDSKNRVIETFERGVLGTSPRQEQGQHLAFPPGRPTSKESI